MTNRVSQLLSQWYPRKDELEWVLGTVIETKGPSYRKAGAMMMINSQGRWYGLLSGGCLESDLMRKASQVMQENKSKIISYDATSEDELSWLLGIGCGGMVKIMLQPVTKENEYLYLDKALTTLETGNHCYYQQTLLETTHCQNALHLDKHVNYGSWPSRLSTDFKRQAKSQSYRLHDTPILVTHIQADPSLMIFGGGVDAILLVNICKELGWRTHLIDHRLSNARPENFPNAYAIHKLAPEECLQLDCLQQCDAAIIMNHNIKIDAASLKCIKSFKSLRYIGLLELQSRKQKVLAAAHLSEFDLPAPLHGPMGINIGGELPESIALSVLAEIHQVLERSQDVEFDNNTLQQSICLN